MAAYTAVCCSNNVMVLTVIGEFPRGLPRISGDGLVSPAQPQTARMVEAYVAMKCLWTLDEFWIFDF